MKYRNLLRSVVFLVVLAIAVLALQTTFSIGGQHNFNMLRGLDLEQKGRLDGVYIGASNVYCFWQPLMAWADHGIAVWSYSTSAMASASVKYYLMQAHELQPDALYIIGVNTFKKPTTQLTEARTLHYSLDYFPWSINRLKATHDLIGRSQDKGLAGLEYYLPIIRFHSRWPKLSAWELAGPEKDYKASRDGRQFFNDSIVNTENFVISDAREPLSEDLEAVVNDLLDYCDREKLNVLFVECPQNIGVEEQGRMNTIMDMAAARGYPCLDLMENLDSTGIDLRTDFSDFKHTNVHGSMKYTRVLGDYLLEHYSFEDKRGRAEWSDWDAASEKYDLKLQGVTLPFERERAPREETGIPELKALKVEGQDIAVRWKAVDAADGYEVFRKGAKGKQPWRSVATAGPEALEWRDEGLDAATEYTYTVVPFRLEGGDRVYGSFDVKGVSAKTKK